MADRDEEYMIKSLVELDDFFIGALTKGGKRGRGTDQSQDLVELSKNDKGHPLYLKMQIITFVNIHFYRGSLSIEPA